MNIVYRWKIKSHLSEKFSNKEAPLPCFPEWASLERDTYFQNLLVLISRRTWCWSSLNSQSLSFSNSSVKEPPQGCRNRATSGESFLFPEPSFTQRKEESCFRPIDPNFSTLFCPGSVSKLYKPLVVGSSVWTTNSVFSGYKISCVNRLQIVFRSQGTLPILKTDSDPCQFYSRFLLRNSYKRDASFPDPMVSSFIHSFIHSYISLGVRSKKLSHTMKWKQTITFHWATGGLKDYIQWGCGLGLQGGSFTTRVFLPQCHAVFSTTTSTMSWVDQRPVSQRVS
jgi:hypothetical protein